MSSDTLISPPPALEAPSTPVRRTALDGLLGLITEANRADDPAAFAQIVSTQLTDLLLLDAAVAQEHEGNGAVRCSAVTRTPTGIDAPARATLTLPADAGLPELRIVLHARPVLPAVACELLRRAVPPLLQARRNAIARSRASEIQAALVAAMDQLGLAVMVVDDAGQPLLATAATQGAALDLRAAADQGGVRAWVGPLPTVDVSIAALRTLGLTRREAEVLAAMMRGVDSARTAAELGISPRTVHKHAQNLYAKLGVSNRLQAAHLATERLRPQLA